MAQAVEEHGGLTPGIDTGVRAVAVYEGIKGVLVLAVASGLTLVHKDVHAIAMRLVEHAHLDPAAKYPSIFLSAAAHLQDMRLLLLASAAVGYVGAVAINLALGGSEANFDPAINFFKDLRKNDPIVPKQTSYARVVSGEMPILFDYDFNAYRAKYSEKGNFEFVIPCEGSVVFPYVVGLVKNAPDKDKAKKVLDYLLSDKGQAIWTNAYLRPARPIELPEAVKKKFLPDSDYARAKNVDWGQMENMQKGFVDRYLAEVR